jgi:hypothetical protein
VEIWGLLCGAVACLRCLDSNLPDKKSDIAMISDFV